MVLENIKDSIYRYCYWIGDSLKRLLCIVSVSAFSISFAVTIYGAIYWAVLPNSAITIPVKWDFTSCEIIGEPCSYLQSKIDIQENDIGNGMGYNIELSLELPDTPINREMGMFLTCATLLPIDKRVCSSAMIPFRSVLVTSLESLLLLPLHIGRILGTSYTLQILLAENCKDLSLIENPITGIRLEIETSKLQISNSHIKIWPYELSGVRHMMYHHPWVSTFLGVTVILMITCLLGALTLAKILQPNRIVVASSPKTKSNHDLADRQARAKLNLEYRQARLQELYKNKEDPDQNVDCNASNTGFTDDSSNSHTKFE